MESRRGKRKLELLRVPKQEASQRDPEANSRRPTADNDGDDGDKLQQFSILLDRIQAMKNLFKRRGINYGLWENEVISRSPWKPSFEWEDFYEGSRHGKVISVSSTRKS
ncbi:hypothetical protein SUGI_0465740 [Cryptomeria japonica]|nr:hypothetical protein SUGI_0465740 [Cryptomeria japonica]